MKRVHSGEMDPSGRCRVRRPPAARFPREATQRMTTTRDEDRPFGKCNYAPCRPGLKSLGSWLHRHLRRRKQNASPLRPVEPNDTDASFRRGGTQGGLRRPGGVRSCLSGRGGPLCHCHTRDSEHPADEALPNLGQAANSKTNRADLARPDRLALSHALEPLGDLTMHRAEHPRRSTLSSDAAPAPCPSPDSLLFAPSLPLLPKSAATNDRMPPHECVPDDATSLARAPQPTQRERTVI